MLWKAQMSPVVFNNFEVRYIYSPYFNELCWKYCIDLLTPKSMLYAVCCMRFFLLRHFFYQLLFIVWSVVFISVPLLDIANQIDHILFVAVGFPNWSK